MDGDAASSQIILGNIADFDINHKTGELSVMLNCVSADKNEVSCDERYGQVW